MFNDPNVTRIGNTIDIYIEPDQKKWTYEKRSTINNGEVFDFESKYKKIATTQNLGDGHVLHRIPYTGWKGKREEIIIQENVFIHGTTATGLHLLV